MALVAVLLPVRNAANTVSAAVKSLLQQTVRDLEVVAIDDGSTDGSGEVLAREAAQDSRVRVLRTEARGLVPALNLGLAESRSPFVARMDADDESLPRRIEVSLAALEADPALAGVGTGVEIFRDDRPASPNLVAYGKWLSSLTTCERLFLERFVEAPLCHPSVTLRRETLDRFGAWRDGPFPEDWELWLRILEGGGRLRCVDEVLFRWRDHDARATRTDARYGRDRHLALRAEVLAARYRSVPLTVWGTGPTGLRLMRALQAHGCTVERLVEVSARKVGQRIDGLPVIAPSALGPPRGFLLSAVGAKGAREEIRTALAQSGWREGEHFLCVA